MQERNNAFLAPYTLFHGRFLPTLFCTGWKIELMGRISEKHPYKEQVIKSKFPRHLEANWILKESIKKEVTESYQDQAGINKGLDGY